MLEDIVWTDHVTTGNGLHNGSKLVVSIWKRLDDSISREKHHPLYPCRFIVEVIGRSLPNSLQSPRAHSPTLIVRFNLMPSILHCQCFNPYIIHYGVFCLSFIDPTICICPSLATMRHSSMITCHSISLRAQDTHFIVCLYD